MSWSICCNQCVSAQRLSQHSTCTSVTSGSSSSSSGSSRTDCSEGASERTLLVDTRAVLTPFCGWGVGLCSLGLCLRTAGC